MYKIMTPVLKKSRCLLLWNIVLKPFPKTALYEHWTFCSWLKAPFGTCCRSDTYYGFFIHLSHFYNIWLFSDAEYPNVVMGAPGPPGRDGIMGPPGQKGDNGPRGPKEQPLQRNAFSSSIVGVKGVCYTTFTFLILVEKQFFYNNKGYRAPFYNPYFINFIFISIF